MRETSLQPSQSLTSEQKCAALEAVLHSQTFARADQLKCFLKYVCEMEMAERGHELTEYLIGIEALGRPANYSPGDDSAVRTRAFALRKKLHEFYEHEQPNAALRIELLKGSYCPRFIESPPRQETNGDETLVESLVPQLIHSRRPIASSRSNGSARMEKKLAAPLQRRSRVNGVARRWILLVAENQASRKHRSKQSGTDSG